ncbi:hypothetical protein QBC34DRAFT_58422 [Podospora aff. communis PSN243]|uniref:Uncharacterized protein n=1 Tax=Podospora aff. communis PSN243 TaxID=3040156 RepID=A0AAV9GT32_9PEZI|nr:hypothetical protein QBC34DRAFT_58422 [Podospora aff. communis PSN243]
MGRLPAYRDGSPAVGIASWVRCPNFNSCFRESSGTINATALMRITSRRAVAFSAIDEIVRPRSNAIDASRSPRRPLGCEHFSHDRRTPQHPTTAGRSCPASSHTGVQRPKEASGMDRAIFAGAQQLSRIRDRQDEAKAQLWKPSSARSPGHVIWMVPIVSSPSHDDNCTLFRQRSSPRRKMIDRASALSPRLCGGCHRHWPPLRGSSSRLWNIEQARIVARLPMAY